MNDQGEIEGCGTHTLILYIKHILEIHHLERENNENARLSNRLKRERILQAQQTGMQP